MNQQAHILNAELIGQARRIARDAKRSLVEVLTELCGVDSDTCLEQVAAYLDLARWTMHDIEHGVPAFERWRFALAAQYRAILLHRDGSLWAAAADPFDVDVQLRVESHAGAAVRWGVASAGDIDAFLQRCEQDIRATAGFAADPQGGLSPRPQADDISIASIADDQSPVVRLVNSALYDALKLGASDIHIETAASGLVVKVRVDGVLSQMLTLSGIEMADQVVSRVKVMADLDIGERRVPQDGRFKLAVLGRDIDFRVSLMPSLFGEDVVIRILDKQSLTRQVEALRLDILGFDADTLTQIRQLAAEPYGMVLVTGPTGSGKTTTLYAALSEIHTGEEKIITIEDPVEYQLPGILQIPVNDKKGLTFARGLRSILRHDPDKILVGEIRDPETAQIAIQSALTGHLVFTSVHANNVFDVIGRFLHMGVDPYSFVSALNGVVGQRLVRVLCTECATPTVLSEDKLKRAGIAMERVNAARLMRGRGCGACRGTGYRGRAAIGEVLLLNDSLREMIASRAPITAIKQAARERGTRFLRDAAVELFLQGRTTLEEINRVTFAS